MDAFSPTRQDVKRYRNLRALSMDLNHKIIKTIPRQAYHDVGRAIGILRKGVLVFDTEDMSSVLMDCCLYDCFQNGKNVVQRYSEHNPAEPGTDDRFLLDAYRRAKYRLLIGLSAFSGAGVHCRDLLNNEELFLMDVGFSHSAQPGFCTRYPDPSHGRLLYYHRRRPPDKFGHCAHDEDCNTQVA